MDGEPIADCVTNPCSLCQSIPSSWHRFFRRAFPTFIIRRQNEAGFPMSQRYSIDKSIRLSSTTGWVPSYFVSGLYFKDKLDRVAIRSYIIKWYSYNWYYIAASIFGLPACRSRAEATTIKLILAGRKPMSFPALTSHGSSWGIATSSVKTTWGSHRYGREHSSSAMLRAQLDLRYIVLNCSKVLP